MPRADRRTWKQAEQVLYSDFDSAFRTNPVTGSLVRITNADSIKQSIRNLVLANRGEWPHHSTLGSKVSSLLFDNAGPITAQTLQTLILQTLKAEPRAQVQSVNVTDDSDQNGYSVTISFVPVNSTSLESVTVFLKRVR